MGLDNFSCPKLKITNEDLANAFLEYWKDHPVDCATVFGVEDMEGYKEKVGVLIRALHPVDTEACGNPKDVLKTMVISTKDEGRLNTLANMLLTIQEGFIKRADGHSSFKAASVVPASLSPSGKLTFTTSQTGGGKKTKHTMILKSSIFKSKSKMNGTYNPHTRTLKMGGYTILIRGGGISDNTATDIYKNWYNGLFKDKNQTQPLPPTNPFGLPPIDANSYRENRLNSSPRNAILPLPVPVIPYGLPGMPTADLSGIGNAAAAATTGLATAAIENAGNIVEVVGEIGGCLCGFLLGVLECIGALLGN